MLKLVRNTLALALSVAFVVGCGSTVAGDDEAYSGKFWRNNFKNYWAVVKRDATDFYRTFDRHVMNYDWDDPTLD